MSRQKARQQKRTGARTQRPPNMPSTTAPRTAAKEVDFRSLDSLPISFQELTDFVEAQGEINPFLLRRETFLRIERATQTPLICYVTKTANLAQGVPAHIDDSDLIGFDDLIYSTPGDAVDVFLISNGGSAEATERIVKMLREHYTQIRFILPANAYSAATLMCLAGNQIIMDSTATLGPIDPQYRGIPARAILRAFDWVKEQLKIEGPSALTAYMPLLSKYQLHELEVCKSAEELSTELAGMWLSKYMFGCDRADPRVTEIVSYLASYDLHKSHARGIDRKTAHTLGLNVLNIEQIDGLSDLVRSLRNQYAFWFDKTAFYKMFENAREINWGRQAQQLVLQLPPGQIPIDNPQPEPQPGPPRRSG